MKVMVIDDSKTARMFTIKCTQMVVGNMELEFLEAENGQEAFTVLEENSSVDLILSDVNMPVMNGFTFLRNLKTEDNLKEIPLIFITSLANDARSENLKSLGASAVIPKPLRPNSLKNALELVGFLKTEKANADGWG